MTQKHHHTPGWGNTSGRQSHPWLADAKKKASDQRLLDAQAEEAKRREAFDRMARGESPFIEPEEKF